MKLPPRLHLPSGATIELAAKPGATKRRRAEGQPLFAEVFEADVTSSRALDALPLGDFHVVRAVLAKAGLVEEEPVDVACVNCGHPLHVAPCDGLEIGPYVDGELDDPELDATLPFGEPHAIPEIRLGRVRVATSVTLEPRTVAEARPLFAAGETTAEIVRAMGIRALGPEEDPAKIADALASATDEAFGAVSDVFLASHYAPRLACVVFCPECRARNDVDAPYDRELEPSELPAPRERGEGDAFPAFEGFAERARTIADPLLAAIEGEPITFVVDDGTPEVDAGGNPLLGAYDPPHAGAPPMVTVWYQSFREEHDADAGFDWDDELRETIEHELEHHVYFLRGHDPMDDEERGAIDDEARRIVGRREADRRALQGFGRSLPEFVRRSWPLLLLALLASLLAYLTQR